MRARRPLRESAQVCRSGQFTRKPWKEMRRVSCLARGLWPFFIIAADSTASRAPCLAHHSPYRRPRPRLDPLPPSSAWTAVHFLLSSILSFYLLLSMAAARHSEALLSTPRLPKRPHRTSLETPFGVDLDTPRVKIQVDLDIAHVKIHQCLQIYGWILTSPMSRST